MSNNHGSRKTNIITLTITSLQNTIKWFLAQNETQLKLGLVGILFYVVETLTLTKVNQIIIDWKLLTTAVCK